MKNLLKQAIHFFGFSGIGWVLDFSTYVVLGYFSENLFLNNCLSSWVGVTFVFIFSTRTIFRNASKISIKLKYLLYILYQCILIIVISKVLNGINQLIVYYFAWEIIVKYSYILSKILVTPITMVLNFFVMKWIIEKI